MPNLWQRNCVLLYFFFPLPIWSTSTEIMELQEAEAEQRVSDVIVVVVGGGDVCVCVSASVIPRAFSRKSQLPVHVGVVTSERFSKPSCTGQNVLFSDLSHWNCR